MTKKHREPKEIATSTKINKLGKLEWILPFIIPRQWELVRQIGDWKPLARMVHHNSSIRTTMKCKGVAHSLKLQRYIAFEWTKWRRCPFLARFAQNERKYWIRAIAKFESLKREKNEWWTQQPSDIIYVLERHKVVVHSRSERTTNVYNIDTTASHRTAPHKSLSPFSRYSDNFPLSLCFPLTRKWKGKSAMCRFI